MGKLIAGCSSGSSGSVGGTSPASGSSSGASTDHTSSTPTAKGPTGPSSTMVASAPSTLVVPRPVVDASGAYLQPVTAEPPVSRPVPVPPVVTTCLDR